MANLGQFKDTGEVVRYVFNRAVGEMRIRSMARIPDEDRREIEARLSDIESIEPLFRVFPDLLEYLGTVARMESEEEFDARGACMENDDAVSTLSRLIVDARALLQASGINEQSSTEMVFTVVCLYPDTTGDSWGAETYVETAEAQTPKEAAEKVQKMAEEANAGAIAADEFTPVAVMRGDIQLELDSRDF